MVEVVDLADADADADVDGDGAAEDEAEAADEACVDDAGDDELGAGAGAAPLPPANLAAKHCFIRGWSVYPWSPIIGVKDRT